MSETVNLYRRWARVAAQNLSPTYERPALAVASDDAVVALLEKVEIGRRQPNLLFGALRWYGVPVEDPVRSLSWARTHPDLILTILRTRRTQTNEVAPCAAILPALTQLPQPLALIEVGASATAQTEGNDQLDLSLITQLRARYDEAVQWGITTNRPRSWPKGNHPRIHPRQTPPRQGRPSLDFYSKSLRALDK